MKLSLKLVIAIAVVGGLLYLAYRQKWLESFKTLFSQGVGGSSSGMQSA